MEQTLKEIAALANKRGFSTDSMNVEDRMVSVSACGTGNGTDCEVDPDTCKAASALSKELKAKYPDKIKCYFDTCDEWVVIDIQVAA